MTNFFIGSSPSMASQIINPNYEYAAAGVMVSLTSLRDRKSDFEVRDWILDSGAFTEIARHGNYRNSVAEHAAQIKRWSNCGNLLIAVAQDYMCEPFVLEKTGLSVTKHQELTIHRYDQLLSLNPFTSIMPVLQGYKVSDYLTHLQAYGDRLKNGQWVGVGSICRRNGKPDEIKEIFKTIKLIRPDLKLHGFGIKKIALADKEIQTLLYSADSMAWSYPRKFDSVQKNLKQPLIDSESQSPKEKELCLAQEYQQKISVILNNSVPKHIPPNAGAGNGQGRKPKWKSGKTKAIRIPEIYADRLLEIAKEWDETKLKFKKID